MDILSYILAKNSGKEYVDSNAVKYTEQELTSEQQAQARANQGLYYETESASKTITWDGDTTDRDVITATAFGGSLYKVSELMPSADDIAGGKVTAYGSSTATSLTDIKTIEDMLTAAGGEVTSGDGSKLLCASANSQIAVMVSTKAQTIGFTYGGSTYSLTIPSTGIFLGRVSASTYWKTLAYNPYVAWDGTTTGLDHATYTRVTTLLGASYTYPDYYKVSDKTPSVSELIDGVLIDCNDDDTTLTSSNTLTLADFVEEQGWTFSEGEESASKIIRMGGSSSFAYVVKEAATISYSGSGWTDTFVFPSTGIYFGYRDEDKYIASLSYPGTVAAVHQIDAKFLNASTIVTITDTNTKMSDIQTKLDEVNADGLHVFFDTSALGAGMYLVTIYMDSAFYRIHDLVTGLEKSGFTASSTKLVDILNGTSTGGHHYTVRWDKTLAQCERLNDAASITTTTTNFGYFGSVNANYDNPFDSIYPWSGRKLCNIDIDIYRTLVSGDSLTDCVTAWEGEEGFSYTDAAGVWVYTPPFYGRTYESGGYRYFDITDEVVQGNIYYPEMITGRYLGVEKTLTVGGTAKTCFVPCVGLQKVRQAMSTMHSNAKNYGGQLTDIYQIDASTLMMVIEYATLNSQSAIGQGVSSLYRQSSDLIAEAGTDVDYVIVSSAFAAYCDTGAILDIGTSNGGVEVGSFVVQSKEASGSNYKITLDRTVTTTTSHYVSIHGLSNLADSDIGSKSGYIGTNGRVNAYYRGECLFGNMYHYILGAYWQKENGHIWIADRGDCNNYDALDMTVHTDTGLVVPSGASTYVQSLDYCTGLSIPPFCTATGGNSTNPVGDYCYAQAHGYSSNRVLLLGGYARYGAAGGAFYGDWGYGASSSHWACAAVPSLITP